MHRDRYPSGRRTIQAAMKSAAGVLARGRTDLAWRLPMLWRYLFYLRTCTNWLGVIRAAPENGSLDRLVLRGGGVVHLGDTVEALIMFRDIWMHRVYTKR